MHVPEYLMFGWDATVCWFGWILRRRCCGCVEFVAWSVIGGIDCALTVIFALFSTWLVFVVFENSPSPNQRFLCTTTFASCCCAMAGWQVGTGFTVSELEDLNELLKDKWKTFDT